MEIEPGRLFRFKQFAVTDQGCGMKVGTDGVLLGSMAARVGGEKVLDVGTGCGLIALMIAQKNPGTITAIDVDANAIKVARHNVEKSPWAKRIIVLETSFQDYCTVTQEPFDLVVCNPPFFNSSFPSKDHSRNLARHTINLGPQDLLEGANTIMADKSLLMVIVPFDQEPVWINVAKQNKLFCTNATRIRPNPLLSPKRSVLLFSKLKAESLIEEMTIEGNSRHSYSRQFEALAKDYLLNA